MAIEDGKILADDAERYLTYREENRYFDTETKKHVAGQLICDYNDGQPHFRVTYQRAEDLGKLGMETQVTPIQYIFVWLMGLRGSYHRMCGTATIECFRDDEVIEKYTAPALWEQMYFGKDR